MQYITNKGISKYREQTDVKYENCVWNNDRGEKIEVQIDSEQNGRCSAKFLTFE